VPGIEEARWAPFGRGLTGQTRLRAFHREAGILELLAQALEVLERAGGTEAAVCRVIAEDGALVVALGPRIGPGHLGVDVEGANVVAERDKILVGSPFDIGELGVAFTTPAPVARERERGDATHGKDHDEEKGKDADAATVAARADSAFTVGPLLDATHEIRQRCRGITSV
jgi:hypothetical protein